jgi:hypothetical protein
MSTTFTKLFASITESTIWSEPHTVRIVWITMLAMADRHGRVWASIPGLANRSRVTLEECEDALDRFQKPDKYSRTPDFGGRRIEPIDGGWRLLNHAKYRAIRDEESALESKRKYAAKIRGAERKESPGQVDKVDQSRSDANTVDASRDNAEAEAEADSVKTPLPPSGGTPGKPGELPLGVPEAKKPRKPRKPKVDLSQDPGFLAFWAAYPKKLAKPEAIKAWAKVSQHPDEISRIVADVNKRKTSPDWIKEGGQYIPYPATYLNDKRWEDIVDTVETKHALGERLRSMRGYPSHIQHCYVTEAEKAEYAVLLERYQAMPE